MNYLIIKRAILGLVVFLSAIFLSAADMGDSAGAKSQNSEPAAPSSAEIVERLLKYGEDGQIMLTYEKDKKTIKTIYIVSVSPLSRNYTKSRAQKKAASLTRINAEQTLVRFLNSRVRTSTSMASNMSDRGSSASVDTRIKESFSAESNALLSSLMKVATNADRDGSYVAVFAWNNKINEGVKKASSSMQETYHNTIIE